MYAFGQTLRLRRLNGISATLINNRNRLVTNVSGKGWETMNDLSKMPPKCQNCPYWEWAEPPYFCDCDERYKNNEIPNNDDPDD